MVVSVPTPKKVLYKRSSFERSSGQSGGEWVIGSWPEPMGRR